MSRDAAAPTMRLLGLCGFAGAGKDFTYGLLRHAFPDARRIAFADPLKAILIAADPKIGARERLSDLLFDRSFEEVKRSNFEVRRLMQAIGTDGIRRHLGDDVWIRAAFSRCAPGLNVFTDVRFPNEERAIHDAGGVIVRVVRPGVHRAFDHVTEAAVDDVREDHVFCNDDSADHVRALLEFVRAAWDESAPPAA